MLYERRPRLLVLTEVGPSRTESAESVRLLLILTTLFRRVDVTIVCHADREPIDSFEVIMVDWSVPLVEPISLRHFDYIMLQGYELLKNRSIREYVARSRTRGTKIILNTLDVHWVRFEKEARLGAVLGEVRLAAEKDFEYTAYTQLADQLLTVGNEDLRALMDAGVRTPMIPIPILVDPVPISELFFPSRGINSIYFVGTFWHRPNVDGIGWFLTNCLPVLTGRWPSLTLHLISSRPAPNGLAAIIAASSNVIYHGYVSDLTPILTRSLCVSPIRYGAGIKGKLIEALSHGVPVCCSSETLYGTQLGQGDGVFVCDAPTEYLESFSALRDDVALQRDCSDRAIRAAAAYSVDQYFESIMSIL